MTERIAYPEWTEYRKKNGLDPLGMQTSSVGYYQSLLPGISNVTLRIRYYGFYAWLSQVYAQKVGDTNPTNWQRFIRRAEALYALIAQMHGGETGIAGITWAARTLEAESVETIHFALAAEPGSEEYYLKQAWGAYGAAYASQLYEIGIFGEAQGHDIPIPTPEMGQPLADAFRESIGEIAERLFDTIQTGHVSRDDLKRFALVRPSSIPRSGPERDCYEKILFSAVDSTDRSQPERRLTLLLLLELSKRTRQSLSTMDVRWMLYANNDIEGKALDFESNALVDHRLKWWIYHANDLLHVAYETLLKFALDTLELHPAGLTLAALIGESVHAISESAPDWPESWKTLIDSIEVNNPENDRLLTNALIKGARLDQLCLPETAWGALKLLAILLKRARAHAGDIELAFNELNPAVFRSLLTEVRFLERHSEQPFSEAVAKLIEERVLRRHLWVALRKLRYQGDYTFLLESDEGKVRMRVKDGPVFTNPRLGPAITFLQDIDLINESGLTEQGEKVLATA